MKRKYRQAHVFLHGSLGICHVRVLVPQTPALRRKGLLGVRRLPEGAGMLFRFDGRMSALTMVGMQIPIDIAFIRRGRLVKWVTARPGERRIDAPEGADMAVELPAGYLAKHQIKPGSLVRLSR